MFVSGQSMYAGMIFSILSFLVAIPSAIKVFNWTATMYKGSIRLDTPMLYALGFIGLFTMGGLTGLMLAVAGDRRACPRHLLRRRAFSLHHGRRNRHGVSRRDSFLVAQDDRTDVPGVVGRARRSGGLRRLQPDVFPQFVLGYLGMPRRYYAVRAEFQVLNVMSTAGASILAVRLSAAPGLPLALAFPSA